VVLLLFDAEFHLESRALFTAVPFGLLSPYRFLCCESLRRLGYSSLPAKVVDGLLRGRRPARVAARERSE
jgi:hypothetical protein